MKIKIPKLLEEYNATTWMKRVEVYGTREALKDTCRIGGNHTEATEYAQKARDTRLQIDELLVSVAELLAVVRAHNENDMDGKFMWTETITKPIEENK